MKAKIHALLQSAARTLLEKEEKSSALVSFTVEKTRDESFGDYASNIAMLNAKALVMKPRDLAQRLVELLPNLDWITKIEIAGPGFINFHLAAWAWTQVIGEIERDDVYYGHSHDGQNTRVQIEFVSANPTGPLHVGHGRGAAYGSVVANLLASQGYQVHREYYVNDAGRQMDILAASVYLRYLELCGEELRFPSNGYRGDYVWDIAAKLHRAESDALRLAPAEIFAKAPLDELTAEELQSEIQPKLAEGDKEKHIDGLIANIKEQLGKQRFAKVFEAGLEVILDDIRDDLHNFGVDYDEWFSERALTASGAVERALTKLKDSGFTYLQGGALWFKSSEFGDEKDRVLLRENGQATYFAADIAYHLHKMERGYDRLINIWGADHHGYVPRVKAALTAMGQQAEKLDVLLVQFAILYRKGERMQMSTRAGEFVTLRQLRKEVGKDAARFFYVMRKCEQHLDFDLDLATSKTNENPVYYVQYAHARICAVQRQATEKNLSIHLAEGQEQLDILTQEAEIRVMKRLMEYPETLRNAAKEAEPHQVAQYLRDLAAEFHAYYNAHAFLVEDVKLRDARLKLIAATRSVLANGLGLLGISAPEQM